MQGLQFLANRLSRAIEKGRTIQLTSAELDILAAIGVYDLIAKASAEELKAKAKERIAGRSGAHENQAD